MARQGRSGGGWRRSSMSLGLLTELDVDALSALCVAWATWVEANEHLQQEGMTVLGANGSPKASPWVGIAAQAQKAMREIGAEFGLSPLSRQRIKVEPPPSPDPFEELLNS
jgi:P27 family predicted phage terminase small subunit